MISRPNGIVDIYRGRVSTILDNISCWDATPASEPQYIEVHNGYPPTLRLEVHRFAPYDETFLHHIVWRVSEKPDFRRLPSPCYGLKEEVDCDALDDYIDRHVHFLIEEETQGDANGPCSAIHLETLRAAYQYAHSNKNMVSDSILV